MNQDYSNYNIIYSYSPFNNRRQLEKMYKKIISEIKPESIIIENANYGRGHFNLLDEMSGLEKISLQTCYVYKKI